jgi:carboxyl-terminal processing protease
LIKNRMKYNNSLKSIILPLIIVSSIAAGVLFGRILPGNNSSSRPPMTVKPRNDKIGSILNIVEARYVDTVNRQTIVEDAIPYILNKLDPHSVYIPARDLQRMNEPLQGNFEGIGVSFNMLTDTVLIISTIPGGPSEKVGIIAGDKIIYVEDSLIAGQGMPDQGVISLLKGPRGTEVNIRVQRKGEDKLLPFKIKRDKIPIFSVDVSYMINSTTGYIKISRFSMTTYQEFKEGLQKLKNLGLEKLILDLRGNVGGVMDPSTQIADEFLEEGKLIVYTEGRASPRQDIYASSNGGFLTGELVILLDELSASASEILAGAIQDNDRGTLVGRRSFGKGLVQEPMAFNDGSAMRLTIARYYTPTGRSIQKSYSNGTDAYYEDLHQRFVRGESLDADSIQFADSLKYTTPGGRTVYGGGGIMPDYFVPVDTSGGSEFFNRLRVSGLIYRYALKYSDDNREKLTTLQTAAEFKDFLTQESIMKKLISFASENGLTASRHDLESSGEVIEIQLKAYIARNFLDNDGFYPIWEGLDTTLREAIDYLDTL